MAAIKNQPSLPAGDWTWIVISSSGGKDSSAAMLLTLEAAKRAGVSSDRLVVSHQDLGTSEWEGVTDLVRQQASQLGLRLEISRYQNKDGKELSLLDYVRKRGKWPSNKNRYCTSEFKRGPGGRVLTRLLRERQGNILNVLGFRADESPARAKREVFTLNKRFSRKAFQVYDWLPAHQMNVSDVWQTIRSGGLPHHKAYDLGMPRLSCVFCIFAGADALLLAGEHNPELLDAYCEIEEVTEHNFKADLSLRDIRRRLQAGERADPAKVRTWLM